MSTISQLFIPGGPRDIAGKIESICIAFGLSLVFGFVHCTGPNSNSPDSKLATTWVVCGMAAVSSASIASSWIGFRYLLLVPILLVVLTPAFALLSSEFANEFGFTLDPLTGFDIIGLSIIAGLEGVLLIPVFAYLRFIYRDRRNS